MLPLVLLTGCGNSSDNSIPVSSQGSEMTQVSTTEEHHHEKAAIYSYDANGHYYSCAGCHENIRFDYESHDFEMVDGDFVCKVCGYAPYSESNRLFAEVQAALNHLYDTDESKTFEIKISQGEDETKQNLTNMTVTKGTYDSVNGFFHAQRVQYFKDSASTSGYSSELKELAHLSKIGEEYRYYSLDDGYKNCYKADKTAAKDEYKNWVDQDSLSNVEFFEILGDVVDYTSILSALSTSYEPESGGSVLDIVKKGDDIIFSLDFSSEYVRERQPGTLLRTIMMKLTMVVNDGFLKSLNIENSDKGVYSSGYEDYEFSTVEYTFEKGFDQGLYDSFENVSEYSDSGSGWKHAFHFYYQDYKLDDMKFELGATTMEYTNTWGDRSYVYCDKDCTKPYDGEPLSSDNDTFYVKMLEGEEIGSGKGLILCLDESLYISPTGVRRNYVKKVGDYNIFDAGKDIYINLKSSENPTKSVKVNGQDYTEKFVTMEEGKVIIVERVSEYYF